MVPPPLLLLPLLLQRRLTLGVSDVRSIGSETGRFLDMLRYTQRDSREAASREGERARVRMTRGGDNPTTTRVNSMSCGRGDEHTDVRIYDRPYPTRA